MIRSIKKRTGQIAVLLAMSFGLMVLLVAMVVNVGFLVAAKINLQNSVDMAAYAGAAQQARYLTEIGKWNYEMRRNYKAMVFDYLLAYSAEMKTDTDPAKNEFKMYVNNVNATGAMNIRTPWVCASLQRASGDPATATTRNQVCQKINAHSFQDAIDKANQTSAILEGSAGLICSIDFSSPACQNLVATWIQQLGNVTDIETAQSADTDMYSNYRDNDPLNYTVRLIAWMTHDYRHLQSRIRGVHFGDISIGEMTSPTQLTGRWDLFKDKTKTQIFSNSPMSVAARVINGFTSVDSSQTKIEPAKANYIDGELLKNPVNEAALRTFKNNLLTVISEDPRLYHLAPASGVTNTGMSMAGGCNGQCPEFAGPYLRLNQHDVNFKAHYTAIGISGTTINSPVPGLPKDVGNFPVGVAKDNRYLTYYTVLGTARTDRIPFNIFFGSEESSNPDVLMVAVASARPFGSRIGPFIDDTCEDLYEGANHGNCIKNGLDPLYPFKNKPSTTEAGLSNFSMLDPDDTSKVDTHHLGVKLAVGDDEYKTESTDNYPGYQSFSVFYGKARKINARARDFKFKRDSGDNGSFQRDDGFGVASPPQVSSTDFFDHDDTAIHPQGNRNSIWAWAGGALSKYAKPSPVNLNERQNYEGYLKVAADSANGNRALFKFPDLSKRKSGGLIGQGPYSVYVFKYPSPKVDKWDIDSMTSRTYGSAMEFAFANAMAVNRFELKRYILPSRNINSGTTLTIPEEVMNYTMNSNKAGNIYGGAPNRAGYMTGLGNKPFNNVVSGMEDDDVLFGSNSVGESYTSWRIGSRGYRVKLMSTSDLANDACSSAYKNCLSKTYTIDDTGGEPVTVDLTKIFY